MKNFDVPTMVHFYDPELNEYNYGIAYNSEIICACCGCVFPLEEVEEIKPLNWVNFVDWIQDENLPYGEKIS